MSPLLLHQLLCSSPPRSLPQPNPIIPRRLTVMGTQSPIWIRGFRPNAASVSGSGAEISEGLTLPGNRQKRSTVAGVDQNELLDPPMLADPDSCFWYFKGVQIHHKICEADKDINLSSQGVHPQSVIKYEHTAHPIILLHGFGASVFSWHRILQPLAKMAGTKVLAFDRPAFGLTSRPNLHGDSSLGSKANKEINPYSTAFSVLATLSFINSLKSEKAILMGHSAGCIIAVNTYFEAPERVAALILVAPAIVAPRKAMKEVERSRESKIEDEVLNTDDQKNLIVRIGLVISKLFKYMAQILVQVLEKMAEVFGSLYRKTLSAFLRSIFAVMLMRMIIDKFGIAAVRNAWCDANQVTDHVLDGYTKPLRVKGWDRALLEYTIALLTEFSQKDKPSVSRRLHEIKCPVLIVTGDNDRLIPLWNTKRLSQAIPGSFLEVIQSCGHMPHEERVDEFLSVVDKFLKGVFEGTHVEQVQALA